MIRIINTTRIIVADDTLFGQRAVSIKQYYLSFYSLKTHYLAFETRFLMQSELSKD